MAFTAIRFVLPFLLQHPVYQPHRDEFLYLDYGRHMDWGYMEVPPLLSLFSWMVQGLGLHIFWVKFFPALFGAATFYLCGRLLLQLGGNGYALLLLFCSFTFSAFLRLFHLFQPGFIEVFFWTLTMYCLLQYLLLQKPGWLLAFGVACGLSILSKYTTLFFLSALLLALVFSPHRRLFFQKHAWMAAGCTLLMILPNVWWQYMHRFPVLAHMRELRETQLVHLSPADFVVEQFIFLLPVVFVWVSGLLHVLRSHQWRFLSICFFLVWLLLITASGKGYYALAIYPVLLVFGSVTLGKWMANAKPPLRWWPLGVALGLGFYFTVIALPILPPAAQVKLFQSLGMKNLPFLKWEDQQKHPLPQDFADMLGWKEITAMTKRVYASLPDSVQKETVIYCRGYFTAGAINYYGPSIGLPEAVSDNGSYLQWIPDSFHFRHLLLIGHRMPGPDDEVFNHFATSRIIDSLSLPLARENGIKAIFFYHADSLLPYFVQQSLQEQRSRFRR